MSYLLKEGITGLARRRLSGSVAVLIMGSSLLMLALFSVVSINLDRVLQEVRGDIDVRVYLRDDIHPKDQERLHTDLMNMVGVRSVQYLDREDALASFREELGEDADLLEALDGNPLPASFEVALDPVAHDAAKLEALTTSVSQYPGVEEVVAEIAWVQMLDRFSQTFILVTAVIGVIVLVSAVFVISNTVRLIVEESAEQVEIMKLVGATNAFIRTPFVVGGAIQGAAAGILAMIVLVAAGRVVQQHIDGIFFFGTGQVIGFVVLSTLLGAGGSLIALRRHLQL